jgi:chromosomal replication initiator protein
MATKKRTTPHVTLRQITAYCLKEYTNITLKDIGIIQGMRDHSTIIHSLKTVGTWMDGAPGFTYEKKLVESIIKTYGEKCQNSI